MEIEKELKSKLCYDIKDLNTIQFNFEKKSYQKLKDSYLDIIKMITRKNNS